MNSTNSTYIRLTILFLLILFAGLFLYSSAMISLTNAVLHRQGSSHGVFVPFLSCFFLWIRRGVIREIKPRYDCLGIPLLVVAAFFPIFNIGAYHLQALCFILFIAGLTITILGRTFFKEVAFPLFFLLTMIPLPDNVHATLAEHVRNISYGGSVQIISLLGIPFYQNGLLIQLPNALLRVDLGCSGIRYLISYFVFGLAYAYLYRKTTRSRLIVIALTIPMSLAASIGRLTAIFVLTYIFGPRMAEYWPHVFISWSVFAVVMILAIASDRFFSSQKQLKAES